MTRKEGLSRDLNSITPAVIKECSTYLIVLERILEFAEREDPKLKSFFGSQVSITILMNRIQASLHEKTRDSEVSEDLLKKSIAITNHMKEAFGSDCQSMSQEKIYRIANGKIPVAPTNAYQIASRATFALYLCLH